MVYVSRGTYGGWIVKGEEKEIVKNAISNGVAKAFFVKPTIQKYSSSEYSKIPENVRNVIESVLEQLPEDARKNFISSYDGSPLYNTEVVSYELTEVDINIKKENERYLVLDIKPKSGARKLTATAVRISVSWYKQPTYASKLVEELRFRYPDNPWIQKHMYAKNYTGYRNRASTLYLKIPVEAPSEILPSVGSITETVKIEEKPRVIVRGFLVISQLPSKALLDAHLPEIFKDIKIGTKEIKLVMGYFYNKLGTLSRKFYCQILKRYAIDAGFGYIVPKEKVPEFLRDVDALKKEYAIYEKQLKEFLLEGKVPPEVLANKRAKVYKEYLDIVREYLRQHGKDEEVRKKIESLDIVGRVRIRLLPFAIDMSILEEYIDERVRKRVEEELYAMRSEIVNAVKRQLEEKAKQLLEKIEQYAQTQLTPQLLQKLRNDFEEIKKLATEFGIESKTLRTLEELISLPEQELVKKVVGIKTSGRVKALLEEMLDG